MYTKSSLSTYVVFILYTSSNSEIGTYATSSNIIAPSLIVVFELLTWICLLSIGKLAIFVLEVVTTWLYFSSYIIVLSKKLYISGFDTYTTPSFIYTLFFKLEVAFELFIIKFVWFILLTM